ACVPWRDRYLGEAFADIATRTDQTYPYPYGGIMNTAPTSTTYRGRRKLGRAPDRGSEFGDEIRLDLRQQATPSRPSFAAIHDNPDLVAVKHRLRMFIIPGEAQSSARAWSIQHVRHSSLPVGG